MRLLIQNIKCLVQTEVVPKLKVCGNEMSELNTITDAYLYIKDGLITEFGKMSELKSARILGHDQDLQIIDATGRFVFPSFCDSHTHLVYAGSREMEYKDKIRG